MPTYRVLIVDDTRDISRMLRAGIESLGPNLEVVDVPSGEEARMEAQLAQFDLLVADIRLPGMSGIELMRTLRKRTPDLKVILVTGVTDPEVHQEAAESKAEAFFTKPIEMADFLDTVEQLLGLVGARTGEFFDTEEAPADRGVSERLSKLRKELEVIATFMTNDHGQILVQAGDLPQADFESSQLPALMTAFSASEKVSRFLGKVTPENFLHFVGSKFDLVMSHVGKSYALLVVTDTHIEDDRMNAVRSATKNAVQDLLEILANIGVPLHPIEEEQPVSVTEPEEEEVKVATSELDPAIAEIFSGPAKIGEEDINSFWEIDDEEASGIIIPDALTYDQALQLGLAPKEESEDSES